MKRFIPVSVSFLSFLSFHSNAYAGLCALCKRSLEQGGNAGLLKGYYFSILLIGGIPLILMAAAVWILYRAEKKRRKVWMEHH